MICPQCNGYRQVKDEDEVKQCPLCRGKGIFENDPERIDELYFEALNKDIDKEKPKRRTKKK